MRLKTFLTLGVLFISCNFAFATKLPDDVWNFVKKEIPSATQRFDSVILIDNINMYVPLYPAEKKDVDKLSVTYTYPQGKSLKNHPEVVILNNNYAFLKVFKDKNGNYTVTQNENLPDIIKLGVMPQDMLVPTGLKVPDSLKIVMGDLLVPTRGDNLLITTSNSTLGANEADESSSIVPINELKNSKAFFTSNKSKFVLVYDKGGSRPLYEIKLTGVPNKIIASPVTKFALCLYFGSKTSEIIDLVGERVLTKIDFENIPSDADIDLQNQIAYVTSAKAGSIYMVDLNSASLAKTIKTDRMPDKISVSAKDKMLVFSDKGNENIYLMDLEYFAVKKIGTVKNLSRLLIGDGRIAAISRTQNKAFIYGLNSFDDEKPAELLREVDLAQKPTDAFIFKGKLFILCSKDSLIAVYDLMAEKMLEPIALDKEGFYSKMTLIPEKNNAIVTGINTKNIIIINLNNIKAEKKAPADLDVADVVIIDDKAPIIPEKQEEAPKRHYEEDAI